MKPEHSEILTLLSKFLERYPEQRFSQALFNLGVLESMECAGNNPSVIKDPYNNTDEAVLDA